MKTVSSTSVGPVGISTTDPKSNVIGLFCIVIAMLTLVCSASVNQRCGIFSLTELVPQGDEITQSVVFVTLSLSFVRTTVHLASMFELKLSSLT